MVLFVPLNLTFTSEQIHEAVFLCPRPKTSPIYHASAIQEQLPYFRISSNSAHLPTQTRAVNSQDICELRLPRTLAVFPSFLLLFANPCAGNHLAQRQKAPVWLCILFLKVRFHSN